MHGCGWKGHLFDNLDRGVGHTAGGIFPLDVRSTAVNVGRRKAGLQLGTLAGWASKTICLLCISGAPLYIMLAVNLTKQLGIRSMFLPIHFVFPDYGCCKYSPLHLLHLFLYEAVKSRAVKGDVGGVYHHQGTFNLQASSYSELFPPKAYVRLF